MEVFPLGGDESEPSITSSLGVETQAPQGSCLLLSIALSHFTPSSALKGCSGLALPRLTMAKVIGTGLPRGPVV